VLSVATTKTGFFTANMQKKKERRLKVLEKKLIAAAKQPVIEVSLSEIRKKGLIEVLRGQIRK
jgi:hypothetical protein